MTPPAKPGSQSELAREVRTYATLLGIGTRVSMAVLVVTFLLYVSGLAAPLIPIDRLPGYWALSAREFMRQANLPAGWGWLRLLKFGDVLNYVGIVMLAGMTIVCYVVILPSFFRRRDIPYVLIVLAEIAVLLFAASGILVLCY